MTYYRINRNNSHFSASIITEYKDWKDYVKGGYYRPKTTTPCKIDGEEDIIPASIVDKELGKAKRTHSTDLVAEVLNVTLLEPEDVEYEILECLMPRFADSFDAWQSSPRIIFV
jgi:hypothetical protein